MSLQPQTLNPLTLPLHGQRLIEASAGTGKTFTIGILYLRLLLKLGKEAAWSRPLSVEEILVVTFTEAATEELRGRIRDNIHRLRIACLRAQGTEDGYRDVLNSTDPVLSQLLEEVDDLPQAADWLLMAERQMDEAAIYTIHGFCQRMLTMNAFESGILLEQHLLENEQGLLLRSAEDFWRRQCYPLPEEVAKEIAAIFSGPEHLLLTLHPWLQGELPTFLQTPHQSMTLTECHAQNIQRIEQLKQAWRISAEEILLLIQTSDVDKRSYSSRNLSAWHREINQWAAAETSGYQLPYKLVKFSQSELSEKTRQGVAPVHPLFDQIDDFLQHPVGLYDRFVFMALHGIRQGLNQEKQRQALLSFQDLLTHLDQGLTAPQGELLAKAIRERYPVAMIDEFQDTDPLQYRIFKRLYAGQSEAALLLIGDPKQAIYAFRGADIFTYIQARNEVSAHYSLQTNWRSSPEMVSAVNRLFSANPNPFKFQDIPFQLVDPAPGKQQLMLWRDGQRQPAMCFWRLAGKGCNNGDYQQMMARHCAADIARWLVAGQQNQAWLCTEQLCRQVTAADITVLVRSRQEAALIRDALQARGIGSVYLSSRDSVYQTPEACELLWLLQAVLAPGHEQSVRTALATSLFGYDAAAIERMSQDSQQWDLLTDQFAGWLQLWKQSGLLPMLGDLINSRALAENLLASERGERRLTDVMHLAELLQAASVEHNTPPALVRFLARQIDKPDINASHQQLRLESDRDLVQIVTVHKSKGLEYPLVWVPFIASYRRQKTAFYHDRTSYQPVLDLHAAGSGIMLAEEERLAEDLRLLYVAVTRSIWHCSLGIAPLFNQKRKYEGATDLHHSAVGYLVQQGQEATAEQLNEYLTALKGDGVEIIIADQVTEHQWHPQMSQTAGLRCREISRILNDEWRVTSYSGLQQHGSRLSQLIPGFDVDAAEEAGAVSEIQLTPHTFPKGAGPGTFLHHLFENFEFTEPVTEQWVTDQLLLWGYNAQWAPVLSHWLRQIITRPLPGSGGVLSQLTRANRRVEMEFYLPIQQPLHAAVLDNLSKVHDLLSRQAPSLDFHQVQGMLKGFIDLVFCWQGKYYLLDYKSNWLGPDSTAYTQQAMTQAMISHRYDLQYQLYSLALHRYLKLRCKDYDYQQHFGGVYYLFLRGITDDCHEDGVFYTRPEHEFIEQLDQLFSGAENL